MSAQEESTSAGTTPWWVTFVVQDEAFDCAEYALITRGSSASALYHHPEITSCPPDHPHTCQEVLSGSNTTSWHADAEEESRFLHDLDVFDWVNVPDEFQVIPSKVLFRTKFDMNGKPARFKTKNVVRRFPELDNGADRAPLDFLEFVRVVVANALCNGFSSRMPDVKTALRYELMGEDAPSVYATVCPLEDSSLKSTQSVCLP